MFSRNNDKPELQSTTQNTQSTQKSTPPQRPIQTGASAAGANVSVIGKDMKIVGDNLTVMSDQPVQIDGEIEGNVIGSRITIGQSGRVSGLVNAEAIHVNGSVQGTVRGVNVMLSSTSNVAGSIHYEMLTVEMGANFEGNTHRAKSRSEVLPSEVNAQASDSTTATTTAAPAFDSSAQAPAMKDSQ